MKKKSSLAKKLASYSALAAVILGCSKEADAQILYTDVNPDDITNLPGVYFLDLNNDGTLDFMFNLKHANSTNPAINQVRVIGYGGNAVSHDTNFSASVQGYYYAGAVFTSSLIGGSDSFKSLGVLGTNEGGVYGNWPGASDRFLGLKLLVDSNIYYGWARLSVNMACDELIVNDYAVDTVANEPIITGDKCGNYSAFANTVINPQDPVICGEGNVVLATDSIAGFTYQWYLGNNIIAGASGSSYTVDSTGNYSVIITTAYGCIDTASVQVFEALLPDAPVITQTGNSLSSSDAFSYQWYSNNVIIPGAISQTYAPPQDGSYTVEITDINGCKNVSSSFAFVLIGIPALDVPGTDIFVANNMVFVQLNDQQFLGGHLNIFNALGDEVYFSTVNSQDFRIDLHQLPAGIYLLTLYKNGRSESRKIVIQ